MLVSCAETKTTIKESSANYENGKLHWKKKIKTVQSTHTQRDAGFARTTTEYFLFYENGELQTWWKLVEDASADNACNETMYELKEYYDNGNKQRFYKMECDCHKEWETTYNVNGKILTRKKSTIKRLY